MTEEPLSTNVSARICRHMNNDHPEALNEYAKHYGGICDPAKSKMLLLTHEAMTLEVDGKVVEIPFDHTLIDSGDAHRTLVNMLKESPESIANT